MSRFIAHVVIRPNEGGAMYTVETEFNAAGYPQAFEHIQGMSRTFDGAIVSHRLNMLDAEPPAGIGSTNEVMRFTPPPKGESRPPLALPAPNPTLTVNAVPTWLGVQKSGVPVPKPFPTEEEEAA